MTSTTDEEDAGKPRDTQAHEPLHRPALGLLLAASVAGVLAVAVIGLPREGAPLPAIARRALALALPYWHTTEPVNEIVYGTRAMDTFGETFLLLAAIVSVVLLTRRKEARQGFIGEERAGEEEQQLEDPTAGSDSGEEHEARQAESEEEGEEREDEGGNEGGEEWPETPDDFRLGTPAPERAEATSVVTRTAVRVAAPVLAVAGVYLVAEGYSPGGGFPAGAVALGVILMLYAGFGYRRISGVVRPSGFEVLEMVGALAIIAIELLGLFLAGSFTANWLPLAPQETLRSGGVVQAFSVTEFVEVGTGLTIAVFALLGMRHDWSPDEGEEDDVDGDDGGGDDEGKQSSGTGNEDEGASPERAGGRS